MTDRSRRVDDVAREASRFEDPAARGSFLDEACSGDDALRHDVEQRLSHMDLADEPTFAGDGAALDAGPALGLTKGERVGNFRLIEVLGEGGFGVVWRAEQTEPVRREVALKVIKPGMDSKSVLTRFEAERQALAVMDHASIARVFDGGATDRGLPYFAMERVRGLPFVEHCDLHKLDLSERIELFIRVCEAVQHAHMKGVIHRDLKPSNILIEYDEGHSTPKIIDFGVAKALNTRLTAKTIFTEQGQLVGTPAYMSPEQAEMSAQDVDTRSDVYSLGVILYELLTGAKPLDAKTLHERGLTEIQRIIREETPSKPSTKLSSMSSDPATALRIADVRGTEVRALASTLRRDLDWVVMKCIEKDRSRRYETVNALAEDLQRFLDDQPVLAGPPSMTYRIGKFVRRNRVAVVASIVVVVALIAATVVSAFAAVSASRERARANDLLAAEQERAAQLELVSAFQQSQLASVDPLAMGEHLRRVVIDELEAALTSSGLAPDVQRATLTQMREIASDANFTNVARSTLEEEILGRALDAIGTDFDDEPALKAALLHITALTLEDLGMFQAAERPLREALDLRRRTLGDEHVETLYTIGAMGSLLESLGRYSEAEPYYREALDTRRRTLGDEDRDTLTSINNMGYLMESTGRFDEAESYYREVLTTSRRVLGDDHPDTLTSINNMGVLLSSLGRWSEAEMHYREALDARRRILGNEHESTLTSISNMGVFLLDQERPADAEPYCREAYETSRRVLGDDHPDTLISQGNLANLLEEIGQLADAERLYRDGLDTKRRVFGAEHPVTLSAMDGLAGVLESRGRVDEAEPLYREALDATRRQLGDEHPSTLTSINNLGYLLKEQGRLAEAELHYREVLTTSRRVFGNDHPDTLISINNMGALLEAKGELDRAETLFRESLQSRRRVLGEDHPSTLTAVNRLAALRRELGDAAEAESLLADSVERGRAVLRPRPLGWTLKLHAEALLDLARHDEALDRATEAYELLAESSGHAQAATQSVVELLVAIFESWHDIDPSAQHDASAAEWRERLVERD